MSAITLMQHLCIGAIFLAQPGPTFVSPVESGHRKSLAIRMVKIAIYYVATIGTI